MKWLLPFLLFVSAGELIIVYRYNYYHDKPNVNEYYLIGMAESVFYGYIFYSFTSRRYLKKIIRVLVTLSVLGYALGFVVERKEYTWYLPTLILSGFFLVVIALAYIYERFMDNDATSLFIQPGFWIAAGVSLFFSGTCIVFVLHDFIANHNLRLFEMKLYNFVPRVLSIVLYGCISVAVILFKKKNNPLSHKKK